jgi:uroporphyrinogen-III decarboxylase
MDGIVDAGVDILNPVGPSDHNDLSLFKNKWGNKIVLHGGISTTISEMTKEQIKAHVEEVMHTGCVGARFIPRTESGIPPMPLEMAKYYIDTLKMERKKGYS